MNTNFNYSQCSEQEWKVNNRILDIFSNKPHPILNKLFMWSNAKMLCARSCGTNRNANWLLVYIMLIVYIWTGKEGRRSNGYISFPFKQISLSLLEPPLAQMIYHHIGTLKKKTHYEDTPCMSIIWGQWAPYEYYDPCESRIVALKIIPGHLRRCSDPQIWSFFILVCGDHIWQN